jgi:hypothetical protein
VREEGTQVEQVEAVAVYQGLRLYLAEEFGECVLTAHRYSFRKTLKRFLNYHPPPPILQSPLIHNIQKLPIGHQPPQILLQLRINPLSPTHQNNIALVHPQIIREPLPRDPHRITNEELSEEAVFPLGADVEGEDWGLWGEGFEEVLEVIVEGRLGVGVGRNEGLD